MIERFITFTDEMARAILDGQKTQTRRIINSQPDKSLIGAACLVTEVNHSSWCWINGYDGSVAEEIGGSGICPYGRIGDRLIVEPNNAKCITLEITDVRVERLQDISEKDARAEGIDGHSQALIGTCRGNFLRLWESIYDAGICNANPWVWVISFKRAEERSKQINIK